MIVIYQPPSSKKKFISLSSSVLLPLERREIWPPITAEWVKVTHRCFFIYVFPSNVQYIHSRNSWLNKVQQLWTINQSKIVANFPTLLRKNLLQNNDLSQTSLRRHCTEPVIWALYWYISSWSILGRLTKLSC